MTFSILRKNSLRELLIYLPTFIFIPFVFIWESNLLIIIWGLIMILNLIIGSFLSSYFAEGYLKVNEESLLVKLPNSENEITWKLIRFILFYMEEQTTSNQVFINVIYGSNEVLRFRLAKKTVFGKTATVANELQQYLLKIGKTDKVIEVDNLYEMNEILEELKKAEL